MGKDITDGFDTGDDEKALEILKKWKGGKLSVRLFTALAKVIPIPCIETVILKKDAGRIQVLLVPRPDNDIVWKGMLHSPGGAIRKSDYLQGDKGVFKRVFERIENQEIMAEFDGDPQFVTAYPLMTLRGPELVLVFLAKVFDNMGLPEGASWHDTESLDKLPNFLKHQLKAIQEAAEVF